MGEMSVEGWVRKVGRGIFILEGIYSLFLSTVDVRVLGGYVCF